MDIEEGAGTKDSGIWTHYDSGVLSSGPSSDSLGKSLHFPAPDFLRRILEQQKAYKYNFVKILHGSSPPTITVQAQADPRLSSCSELSVLGGRD